MLLGVLDPLALSPEPLVQGLLLALAGLIQLVQLCYDRLLLVVSLGDQVLSPPDQLEQLVLALGLPLGQLPRDVVRGTPTPLLLVLHPPRQLQVLHHHAFVLFHDLFRGIEKSRKPALQFRLDLREPIHQEPKLLLVLSRRHLLPQVNPQLAGYLLGGMPAGPLALRLPVILLKHLFKLLDVLLELDGLVVGAPEGVCAGLLEPALVGYLEALLAGGYHPCAGLDLHHCPYHLLVA
jgi:hypothetical protein